MSSKTNSPNQSLIMNQNGQGAVEYVLVLVVTVGLAIGLLRTFNTGVRVFTQQFFGTYVQCLLIAGELPTLGSEAGSGCTMPNFSFSPPPDSGTDDSGSGAGGGGGPTQASNSSDDENSEGGDTATASAEASASSQATAGVSEGPPSGGRFNSRGRPSRVAADSSKKSDGKSGSAKNGGEVASADALGRSSESTSGRVRYITGEQSSDDRRGSNKNKDSILSAGTDGEEGARPRFVAATSDEKSEAIAEPEDDWSFGNLFKYIIIAAAVIAMLLILGGQAMQIKKGMEG
jgi:hypothetical protein